MRINILLLFFILNIIQLNAQIKFDYSSTNKIFEKARKENKLIILGISSSNCEKCNEHVLNELSNDSILMILKSNFIITNKNEVPLEITYDSSLIFSVEKNKGFLCLDNSGNILSAIAPVKINRKLFLEFLHRANVNKTKEINLSFYLNEFTATTKKEFNQIKNLLNIYDEIGLYPSQYLLDLICETAPEDSAKSRTFIQYLLKHGPQVNSKAFQYIAQDGEVFNTSWFRMDLKERVAINNLVFYKSMMVAIEKKDKAYAEAVANFKASSSNTRSFEAFQRTYDFELLRFYKAIKDTNMIINWSMKFVESYIVKLNVDSILRIDSLNTLRIKASTHLNQQDVSSSNVLNWDKEETAQIAKNSSFYSNILNEAAWTIYVYTKDNFKNNLALKWSKKSIEFEKNYAVLDTYARLLYRNNKIDEAITYELEAIKLAKEMKAKTTEFEQVLQNMNNKAKKIDEY
ncbi:MAG: hypothetical protein KGZ59_11385 [Chitinophagaceae bacterium]|nr:hypothetical protein [Chitinophagaceae bacterium]